MKKGGKGAGELWPWRRRGCVNFKASSQLFTQLIQSHTNNETYSRGEYGFWRRSRVYMVHRSHHQLSSFSFTTFSFFRSSRALSRQVISSRVTVFVLILISNRLFPSIVLHVINHLYSLSLFRPSICKRPSASKPAQGERVGSSRCVITHPPLFSSSLTNPLIQTSTPSHLHTVFTSHHDSHLSPSLLNPFLDQLS